MKKLACLLLGSLLLCGCSGKQMVETVSDEWLTGSMVPEKEISVQLPANAVKTVMSAEDGAELYFCEDYILTLQTIASGDLDRSARSLCGYSAERLSILQTKHDDLKRYDWTWTSAGEGSVQVGRAAVLDDGEYHYCLTVMAEEAVCADLDEQWDMVFRSFDVNS